MKTLTSCLMVVFFFLSGCTFNVEVMKPEPSQPASIATQSFPLQADTPIATISPTAGLTFTPTAVPPTTYPFFSNARLGFSPEDASGVTSFPAGTKAVYAIWDYQNMRDGLMIKREWYWNGQPWIVREEPWDFKKYGANGTIRDISIYDNETGLNSGNYQLRLYIDNMLQPIGPGINTLIKPWINFEIGPHDSYTEYASPDYQWVATVLNGNRLVVLGPNGTQSQLYTGREIPYVVWFPDGRHVLFIDRYHVDPGLGAEGNIQDVLQIADITSKTINILHESDAPLGIRNPPLISPDGRYIATTEGTGGGDACFVSLRTLFLEMAADDQRATLIEQKEFSGLPNNPDSTVYPSGAGTWLNNNEYLIPLKVTCTMDESLMGSYIFNMTNKAASQSSTAGGSQIPGDLGRGTIHGRITNAATGAPIAGATVTCEHHSYTSPALCSGSTTTNAEGVYLFDNIFFHDTDSLKLSIQATGYHPQEVSLTSFTITDVEANAALNPVP